MRTEIELDEYVDLIRTKAAYESLKEAIFQTAIGLTALGDIKFDCLKLNFYLRVLCIEDYIDKKEEITNGIAQN